MKLTCLFYSVNPTDEVTMTVSLVPSFSFSLDMSKRARSEEAKVEEDDAQKDHVNKKARKDGDSEESDESDDSSSSDAERAPLTRPMRWIDIDDPEPLDNPPLSFDPAVCEILVGYDVSPHDPMPILVYWDPRLCRDNEAKTTIKLALADPEKYKGELHYLLTGVYEDPEDGLPVILSKFVGKHGICQMPSKVHFIDMSWAH
jgi:hypothetical protein